MLVRDAFSQFSNPGLWLSRALIENSVHTKVNRLCKIVLSRFLGVEKMMGGLETYQPSV